MRIYQLVLLAFFLIAAGCGPKIAIVDPEFLSAMTEEETKKIEVIEREIVELSDEQQSQNQLIRTTHLEMQILRQETKLLDREKSILTDRVNLYKIKKDSSKIKRIQEKIHNNSTQVLLNGLIAQVLDARLADEKTESDVMRAELGQKIAERTLMQAQIGRVQQDKIFGDDPNRTGDKIDVALFETNLKGKKQAFLEKKKLSQETRKKLEMAQSKLEQKQSTSRSTKKSQEPSAISEEATVEAKTSQEIQNLIGSTQLEMKILKQEKELLEGGASILVDQKRLFKFKNNSLKQKEIQEGIQKNKEGLVQIDLLTQVLEARLAYEKAQRKTMKAELEHNSAESALKEAQNKPKKAGQKSDFSALEKQVKVKQLHLQKEKKLRLDTKNKLEDARNKLKVAQTKTDSTEVLEKKVAVEPVEETAISAETTEEVLETPEVAPEETSETTTEETPEADNAEEFESTPEETTETQ